MKMLAALLITAALLSPAFAQKPTFQGTRPRPKAAIVAPAAKPMFLHTGKPITLDQKQQLMVSAIKSFAVNRKVQPPPVPASATMITPSQMYKKGVVDAIAYAPYFASFGPDAGSNVGQASVTFFPENSMKNAPGYGSYLDLIVYAQPNTVYVLKIQVNVEGISPIQHLAVAPYMDTTPPQTFPLGYGIQEFAYAFVSNDAGQIDVAIRSPDAIWDFLSCEITSAAF
jgi:hypothetical protein